MLGKNHYVIKKPVILKSQVFSLFTNKLDV